ncbi:MAG TPA: hypothetical protein VH375_00055 [Rhodanobacteraceae bacterium]
MNDSLQTRCRRRLMRSHRLHALMFAVVCANAIAADHAGGSVTVGKHSAAIKNAVLVRGPDEMNAGKTLLRLYLSSADVSAKIKACKTLSCADGALTDGAAVDFSDAPHLGYWVTLNGGLAQYSGGTRADAFALSTNTADHLAGKLHIDDAAMGGAKIDADFDAALANTFKTVR